MSKDSKLIAESLTEMIDDLKKTGGKNLKGKVFMIEGKPKVDAKKSDSTKKNRADFNEGAENESVPV